MTNETNVIQFVTTQKELSFQDFGKAVMEGSKIKASRVLRDLFKIDYKCAEEAAEFVITSAKTHPNVLMEIINVRFLIQDGKKNDAILLIQKLFNLSGINSLKAFEGMYEILKENKKLK